MYLLSIRSTDTDGLFNALMQAGALTAVATTGNDGIDYTIIDDIATLRVSESGTAPVLAVQRIIHITGNVKCTLGNFADKQNNISHTVTEVIK